MSTESNRFGKYRLLKRVGAGGMGEVHLAKLKGPAGFEKLVVIKRLLENRRSEQRYVDMFFSEARVTAQLSHSNIVQIYEVDYCDGIPYIAMEYVRGKSLRHILDVVRKRGGPKGAPLPRLPRLPAHYVVQIFYELCSGLAFAHDARHLSGAALGLIHRDINPHNVLLTYRGEVKLIDFGIAKSELTLDKTQAGTIKGTVIYMSPEQSAGRKLDRRSDMFSVGICLYEILTGSNPFHKDNMAASLEAIRNAEVLPLDPTNPEVAPFQSIISRALARSPQDRFADCEEMGYALQALLLEGKIPRLEVPLSDYLQRLFVEDIDAEDRLLSQTELVEIADLGPVWAAPAPVVPAGEKTRALGAAPADRAENAGPGEDADSADAAGSADVAEPAQTENLSGPHTRAGPSEISDVHTQTDPLGRAGPLTEQSGVGAPVRLPEEPRDTRPTQRFAQSGAFAAEPNVAAGDVTAMHHAIVPKPFNMADDDTRAEYRMPGAAAAAAPRVTAAWEVVQRRLAPLRNPRAYWEGQTISGRLGLAALSSVVVLGILCAGLAVMSPAPVPESAKAKATSPVGTSAAGASSGAATAATPPNAAQGATTAAQAAPGSDTTAEAGTYNEEVRLEAMADTEAAGIEAPGRKPGRHLPLNRRRLRGDHSRGDGDDGGPSSLQIAMDPAVTILKDGVAVGHRVNLHAAAGILQFGPNPNAPAGSQFSIKVHYQTHAKAITYTVESEPWANVFGAGGIALGRTPIKEMPGNSTTVLEFKNPRLADSQRITLHYSSD